jgi:Xaa-Pro dipeptidase
VSQTVGLPSGFVAREEYRRLMDEGMAPRFELGDPFDLAEYESRLGRLREEIDRRSLDAMLVSSQHSLYYLYGYDIIHGAVLFQLVVQPRDGAPVAVVRWLDADIIRQNGLIEDVRLWNHEEPVSVAVDALRDLGLLGGRLGVETRHNAQTPHDFAALKREIEAAGGTVIEASDMVNELRVVKSDAEVAQMRRAGELLDIQYEAAFGAMVPGARECDVAAAALAAVHSAGADPSANPLQIASGMNTRVWTHLGPTRRKLQAGDPILMESAACFNRYHAVGSHTVVCGAEPTAELVEAYGEARETVDAARAVLGPGMTSAQVAQAVRDAQDHDQAGYLEDIYWGYGIGIGYPSTWWEYFLHSRSDRMIEENMTIALFGFSSRGARFAVLVVDPIVITADGFEDLSRLGSPEIRVVGR